MKFLSVCSGIEAASVAWSPLGWKAAAFAEIEPFPCSVLAHHYPDVPNRGDMTKFKDWPDEPIDLLCGGTPCQSFSVAGLRKGLDDPRGNLMLTYLAIAAKYRPKWVVWENVPGVHSSWSGDDAPSDLVPGERREATETSDFGSLLGGLAELGYGFAYRIYDAQYFGVAQRRRRVFVVGCLGDWRSAAAVLFERHSLQGHPAPRRETGKAAPTIPSRSTAGGGLGTDFDCDGGLIAQPAELLCVATGQAGADMGADMAPTLNCNHEAPYIAKTLLGGGHSNNPLDENLITQSLTGEGFDASEDGTGRGAPLVPVAQPYTLAIRGRGDSHNLEYRQDGTANALLTPNGGRGGIGVGAVAFDTTQVTSKANRSNPKAGDPCHPLAAGAHAPAIAFDCKASGQNGFGVGEIASTQRAMGHANSHTNGGGHQAVMSGMQVRRLTPKECARLQGFPDDYLDILHKGKPAADGNKYKALGNSWAVPNVRWIGERIAMVDALTAKERKVA